MFYIRDGRIKFGVYYLLTLLVLGLQLAYVSDPIRKAILNSGFLITCITLGIGLGLDVMAATVSRFQILDSWSPRCMWAFRTAASHTIIALLGVLACVVLTSLVPALEACIRIFGLIAIYIVLIREGLSLRRNSSVTAHDETNTVSKAPTSLALELGDWILVLSVSIDAAISVPAQNAVFGNWDGQQLIFALLVVGLLVGLCAIAGGLFTAWLSRIMDGYRKLKILSRIEFWGFLSEVTVMSFIAWRGFLPLWLTESRITGAAIILALLSTFGFYGLIGRSNTEVQKAIGS